MSAKKVPAKHTLAKKSAAKKAPTTEATTEPTSGQQEPQNAVGAEPPQSKARSNQEGQANPLPLSPRREKLVGLATQLVAAQITASASYQAAVDVAREQREMLVECLETLSGIWKSAPEPEHMPKTNPAIPEVVLARLKYSQVRIRKPLELSPLSSPELDQLFASAMYRAQKLLGAPEQDRRMVWAEQIFEPDEILSENQIFETFRMYNWPNLTGRPSVVELMTDVDNWFSAHYSYLGRVDGDENKTREGARVHDEIELLVQVLDLFDERANDGFNRQRHDYKAVADEIKCFLRSQDTRILDTLSRTFWNNRAQNLIFMMFNQSAPLPRDSKPGDNSPASKAKAPTRIYRPWGIFRYLRLYAGKSGDETGAAINSRIRKALKLNPDLVENVLPVAPPEFEFGPIGADMDDLLDSLEPEDTGDEDTGVDDDQES